MNQGGKGANQAVAIKRLGGNLIFMAKLGNDVLGRQSVGYFKKEGIDTRYIALDEDSASGVALISVDDHAENSIVVASGANMLLNEQDVDKMLEEMCEGDILLMQLEIPLQTVEYAARKAFGKGVKVVLNPAPARSLPKELFRHLYMVTPNRIEAEMLTGIKIANDADVEKVAEEICAMGVKNVIITLGSKGCLIREEGVSYRIDAFAARCPNFRMRKRNALWKTSACLLTMRDSWFRPKPTVSGRDRKNNDSPSPFLSNASISFRPLPNQTCAFPLTRAPHQTASLRLRSQ